MPKKLVQAKNTKATEAEKSNSSTKKRNQKKNEVSESEEEEEDIQVNSKPQRRNTRSSQGGKPQSNSKEPNKKKIKSPSSEEDEDNDFSEEEAPKKNGKTQAVKKGQKAQSKAKRGSTKKQTSEESDPEEEEEKDFSEEEVVPKRNGRSTRQAKKTPSVSKKGSTKSKSQIESEPESEEEISSEEEKAKKKKGSKGSGKKNSKKKDDSDEDFNIGDESDHQNSDMEEENALKKTLKDDGSDFEPLEPWEDALDQKAGHKLKRVKKSPTAEKSTTKKGSTAKSTTSKGSTSKKDDMEPVKGAQKGSRKGKVIKGSNVRVFQQQDKEDEDGEHNGEFFPSDEHPQFDDSAAFIPSFIQEPNVRDANGKYSNEEGYDPTTLYVPPEEIQKSPPIIKEYWKFKSKHFDKLVAVKIWKFYHFYFNDALIVHRIIDMKLSMWGNRTLTFFHESCMTRFAPKLLAAGHKIVIIEQMTEVKKEDEDLVKREICQILTRGTAIENQELDYASRFMLAVFEDDLNFGIVLVDTTTHEFYTGEFKDDAHRSNLRTVITRAKPVEIVYMRSYIEQDTINMFKSLSSKPTLSTISFNEPKHFADVFDKLDKYLTPKDTSQPKYPQFLQMIKDSVENDLKDGDKLEGTRLRDFEKKIPFYFMMQAFAICTDFLEDVMLAETVLSMGHFFPFDLAMEKKGSLYLDSQSLMNLEILDVQYLNVFSETYSLFGYMDNTVTAFGKRMLKRWVTAPYLDATKIKERQEAIEDLMNNPELIQHYQERVRKFPDLERAITRVYNLSNRQRMSAIYFEDFAKNRLKEFLVFLGELKKVEELVESLAPFVGNLKSKRLIQIMCFKDVDIKAFEDRKKVVTKKGKGKKKKGEELEEEKTETAGNGQSELPQGQFPRIADIISDLEGMVELKEGLPLPAAGVSKETDEVLAKINEIKTNLHNYLEQMKKKLGSSDIKYVHTKHRYVPESVVEGNKRPKDFAVTSKRKGYLRFHSPEIEANIRKLWPIETEFHKVLIPFICAYFRKFYERHTYWQQVINCLGELDCLCSLAILANSMPVKCKPEVLPLTNKPIFDLKGMVHPMAAKNNPNFVPNDVEVENDVTIFLITGPNMGGKSTLLRQTCLAVIMAQVGSFVPAESFRLSAIDRIFTRVGASDRILEGKSTFFVEMEETYNIMQEATKNSLLIIDELGRGTSTYDGVAIAYATLKFIAERIGCITLFATHYHLLLEEFKLYKNIETYYMRCEVNEKTDELKFLYRFGKGEAVKSHGIIIAKVAGLPEDTVIRAKEKAAFITTEKKNIGFEKSLMEKFNKIIHEISNIEEAKDQEVDRIFNELQQLH